MDKKTRNKHPSLPVPGSSKKVPNAPLHEEEVGEPPKRSWRKRCCRYMYDRNTKKFCGRTCKSWLYILVYTVMYLIFLSTYTLIFLYGSLLVIKYLDAYQMVEKTDLLTYAADGIGLSATPTSLNAMPLIWYRNEQQEYQKYVKSLESLLIIGVVPVALRTTEDSGRPSTKKTVAQGKKKKESNNGRAMRRGWFA
ncbi:jg6990 [Pararge aegeria aegeria]|uniref:Jg6990 protein n=1 Tax=Pararge aegeria aegeria TaxID=348720 RepID=A0A8S4SA45_9NEOP|nr:jg6990 [Pararge aegeria aegeria]